jgi:hypothetical protein
MVRSQRDHANRHRALDECTRLGELAQRGTRLREVLERDDDRHVVRRVDFLADYERLTVQALRGGIIAESVSRRREAGEHGGDVRMLRPTGAPDRQQSLEQGLGARIFRSTQVNPAQLVQRSGEFGIVGPEVFLAHHERFGVKAFCFGAIASAKGDGRGFDAP